MSKKLLIGVGVVVLALVIVVWQGFANLNSIVAGMIEDVGSEVLNTRVSVSGMAIDLTQGKVGISRLTIANPDGYSRSNVFEMEGIEVELALNSLGKDILVIESILIRNPKISYEGDESGGSNMQTLLNNMDGGSSTDDTSGGDDIQIIINRFELTGAQVKASSPLNAGKVSNIKLPGIGMTAIGRDQGGVTVAVAIEKITKELLNEIIRAAAKAGVNKVIEEKKKGFMDKLKEVAGSEQ